MFGAVAERYFAVVVGSGRTLEKLLREDNNIVEIVVVHRSAVYVNLPFEFWPQGLPVALKDVTQIVAFALKGSHFVIDLHKPRVEIAAIAPIPDGLWMQQLARNPNDDFNGFLRGKRYVIHDRDPLCTEHSASCSSWQASLQCGYHRGARICMPTPIGSSVRSSQSF